MKLSVVVPCYNEAANVSEFESELSKALLKEKITYKKYLMILGIFICVLILSLIK